jgi:hypothetical protein
MSFETRIHESIRGRNLGFEFISSATHGSTQGGRMLVGPEALRAKNSTAESTGTNLRAFGHSVLNNSSAGSSQVWMLDPPIPGVQKSVIFNTTVNTQYLRASTDASITFLSATQGTTKCILSCTGTALGLVNLIGITTAVWGILPANLSSGYLLLSTST